MLLQQSLSLTFTQMYDQAFTASTGFTSYSLKWLAREANEGLSPQKNVAVLFIYLYKYLHAKNSGYKKWVEVERSTSLLGFDECFYYVFLVMGNEKIFS